ncbi:MULTISPECIES: DUF6912 family protein [unclassified Corynebacterium]|uniref:DUF6912 family protein n=1 Tax=unclassified Corynebacterium TaxID=2624378 RepID=UPI0029C9E03D|nr:MULTISPECIES: hypothetical protein [unclassified Corynebacterium]WPF66650.1 hypothetical protein OLX12_02645 [Corynebacterium sp. 22KM0430]WPF69138.1 hypothetical protein OLW90_02640 [Corynebacterium sp. 21KM1197]
MRVYIPATFSTLRGLNESRVVTARSGWAFAVTPALREFYTEGDEEEIAHAAFQDAAEASLRLLAVGDEEDFPHRRVVISADVPDHHATTTPENGESVVKLNPAQINLVDVAAIHVDVPESEEATAKAIAAIDAADLGDEDAELTVGDALDNFLAWYDPSELPVLVELL